MFRTRGTRLSVSLACGVALIVVASAAVSALEIGASRVDITPPWQKMKVQLGGYGDREGKPAEGVHDPLSATAIVLREGEKKVALVACDILFVPSSLKEEVLNRIAGTGLDAGSLFMSAAHNHSGHEGFAMARRNVFNNKYIGIFTEDLLLFTADKLAACVNEACGNLAEGRVSVARRELPGLNRNRRGDPLVDDELMVAKFETMDGAVKAVLVNWTAHPTILGAKNMLISGEWPGYMQRYISANVEGNPVVLYTNGAEGDQSVAGAQGATPFERVENYGVRIGQEVVDLLGETKPTGSDLDFVLEEVDLPPRQVSFAFKQSAGDEYKLTPEEIEAAAKGLFPARAPFGVVRIGDLVLMYIPGEPIAELGLAMKEVSGNRGFAYPAVVALSNDLIGYILTTDEYREGGYEPAVSFYGDMLGPFVMQEVTKLVDAIAKKAGKAQAKL
jgi:neutral ceramidase